MTAKDNTAAHPLMKILVQADQTYRQIPPKMRMEIEQISQSLTAFGPRKLKRRGLGTEFFEARDFRPGIDEPRKINARLSARAGRSIVVEKEAEIRHHYYLWRDASPSMDFASSKSLYTKKEASEVMLLAFAKHLARNEEAVGVLDGKGIYHGGRASEALAHQMMDVTILTADVPLLKRNLPRHSSVIMFSDFLVERENVIKGLEQFKGRNIKGYLVMVLDPQEIDFKFRGHTEFKGLEGEGKIAFKKAESLKDDYQKKIREHIEFVKTVCEAAGFKFILQRTDRPLHKGLLEIYGLTERSAQNSPVPEL